MIMTREIGSVEAQFYLLERILKKRDYLLQNSLRQTYLVVQWLRRCTSTARGPVGSLSGKFHAVCGGFQKEKEKKQNQKTSVSLTALRDRWSRCVPESHSVIWLFR